MGNSSPENKYLKRARAALSCSPEAKKDFARQLHRQWEALAEDFPGCSYEKAVEILGEPSQAARDFVAGLPDSDAEKAKRHRRKVRITLGIGILLLVVALVLYTFWIWKEKNKLYVKETLVIYSSEAPPEYEGWDNGETIEIPPEEAEKFLTGT